MFGIDWFKKYFQSKDSKRLIVLKKAFSIIVWRPNKGRKTDCNEIIDVNLECSLNTSIRINFSQMSLVYKYRGYCHYQISVIFIESVFSYQIIFNTYYSVALHLCIKYLCKFSVIYFIQWIFRFFFSEYYLIK